jgi:5'-nucleotidase
MKNWIIFLGVFMLLLSCNKPTKQLVRIEGKQLPINAAIEMDQSLEQVIAPYRDKVAGEMRMSISYTPVDLTKNDGKFESSLGNLVADMCYELANPIFKKRTGKTIDFALFNHGGIRTSIGKGPITNEDAFKLMPFENMLVVVEITPAKLLEFVTYLRNGKTGHPLSKSVQLRIAKADFLMTIHGNTVDLEEDRNYFILTTDYLQKGGDRMNFLKDPINLYPTDYKMRNALIDYLKKNDTVKPVLDGRLIMD